MTETQEKLRELQKEIAHLAAKTEDGWLLKWGSAPQNAFELVCRGTDPLQMQSLDLLVSEAHKQACERFGSPAQ
jgi:hypothetical protein